MSARFDGSTVLVTGASRGLGRALAVAFGAEGAQVYVGYHARLREAEATVSAVRETAGDAAALQLDVRQDGSVVAAIEQVLAARGGIDVLVNNAGVVHDQLFAISDPQAWNDVVGVNLGGVLRCCRAVVRSMIARKRGAIVNVASIAAVHASPGLTGYAASKGGVVAFTRTLAAELAPKGVRVNAVVPGFVASGMGARLDARIVERMCERIRLGRFAAADEVARVVLFLASADASYVVGQALVVDGGLSL